MANYGPQATESAIISPLRDHTRESVATVDQDRFRAIYDQYVRAIYQYCYRRLPTIEDAEDATSLIFAKAMSSLSRQRDDEALRSWLFSIAHNVIADHYRSRRVTVDLASVDPRRGLIESPESHALAADELRTLLNQLPAEQTRILELRLAGLNGPEIARVLGKSHSAVKVAQFRAYSRLRQLLESSRDAIGAASRTVPLRKRSTDLTPISTPSPPGTRPMRPPSMPDCWLQIVLCAISELRLNLRPSIPLGCWRNS